MTNETGRVDFVDSTHCWLCGSAYLRDERVCSRCGSTRVLSHEAERLERNAVELVALMNESEAIREATPQGDYTPAPRRWARASILFPFGSSDTLVFLAHGALGAFIGGSLWYVVAVLLHSDVGALAILMGFFTGKGISLSTPYRRATLTPIAILVTAAMWDLCCALFTAQGISLSPLDAVFLIVSIVAAAAPIDFLPRNTAAR